MLRLCLILCLASAGLMAQPAPENWQYPPRITLRPGAPDGVVRPRVIRRKDQEYSPEALLAGLAGTLSLALTIDESGRPDNLRLEQPLGLGMDERAIEAVSAWRFEPIVKDGNPVRVQVAVELNFWLPLWPSPWHLARVGFEIPEDATRPVLVSAEYPKTSGSTLPSFATIAFDVDSKGVPANLRTVLSSQPELASEARAIVESMRFRPAIRNGSPIAAACTMTFALGKGVNPVAQDSDGSIRIRMLPAGPVTLEDAVLRNQAYMVQDFLNAGADVNVLGSRGNAPLDDASLKGSSPMVKLLLQYGAKVDIRSKDGTLPLHDAVLSGDAETVRALLSAGADLAAVVEESKETPLHLAASLGKLEVLKVLLAAGAPRDAKDAKGRTPLDTAAANSQPEAAALLQAAH